MWCSFVMQTAAHPFVWPVRLLHWTRIIQSESRLNLQHGLRMMLDGIHKNRRSAGSCGWCWAGVPNKFGTIDTVVRVFSVQKIPQGLFCASCQCFVFSLFMLLPIILVPAELHMSFVTSRKPDSCHCAALFRTFPSSALETQSAELPACVWNYATSFHQQKTRVLFIRSVTDTAANLSCFVS